MLVQGSEVMRPRKIKVGMKLDVTTDIHLEAANHEYDWSIPLLEEEKEMDASVGLAPTPFVLRMSGDFSPQVVFSGKIGYGGTADAQIIGTGISFELEITTGGDGQQRAEPQWNTGDWTHAGTR